MMSGPIDLLRIGNPWMVGEKVDRIVPVYVLHNLLNRVFEPRPNLQAIKHLTQDPLFARSCGFELEFRDASDEEVRHLAYGLMSPERRVFKSRKGGASQIGALFPLLGGFGQSQASDDGLGRRLSDLLDSVGTDWHDKLSGLMAPTSPKDPATALALALAHGEGGRRRNTKMDLETEDEVLPYDVGLAQFVSNLIPDTDDASRVAAIRDLALGAFLVAVLRMVFGPIVRTPGYSCGVFVYAGLPPGESSDPLVQAASLSMSNWVDRSWQKMADVIAETIDSTRVVSGLGPQETRRQQLRLVLGDDHAILDSLTETYSEEDPRAWAHTALTSESVRFSKSALLLRVRNLAKTIGFAAPDRGVGEPRLVLDTPLLAVLVRGLMPVGETSMDFREFVSALSQKLGLVLGIGTDDEVAERLNLLGGSGLDIYELLDRNEELLRTRLLRVGLARSYSDSHTEVVLYGN